MFYSDLRLAWRGIVGSLGRSLVIVASLGIGMALTTITYTFARGVLVRPLAVADAGSLVRLREDWGSPAQRSLRGVTAETYEIWKTRSRTISEIAAASYRPIELERATDPLELGGARVTPGFLELFGLHPTAGRFFGARTEDDTVVLSQRLANRLGLSSVGTTLRLDGRVRTIIGIAPAGFNHPYDADVWLPLDVRDAPLHYVPARLRKGISPEDAERELATIARGAVAEGALTGVTGANVVSLRKELLRGLDRTLPLLFGGALLVLIVAIANVSALLVADALQLRRSAAIRFALGARPADAMRFFVLRIALLAFGAATIAAACALAIGNALANFSGIGSTSISEWGAAVTFGAADAWTAASLGLLSTILLAIAPARVLARAETNALGESQRGSLSHRTRRALYASASAQTAIVLVLAIFACSLIRQFADVIQKPLGFRTAGVVAATVYLPESRFPDDASRAQWISDTIQAAQRAGAVSAVGATTQHPGSSGVAYMPFNLDGNPAPDPPGYYHAHVRQVTPGFFAALGIELQRGRFLAERDMVTHEPWPVVINESFALRHFPGRDSVGQEFRLTGSTPGRAVIVGIARDVAAETADAYLDLNAVAATMYLPITTMTEDHFWLIARAGETRTAAAAIRQAVAQRPAPITIDTMEHLFRNSRTRQRFAASLGGVSAAVALVLAMLGIHSVTAFLVAQQRRAIGIRLAVGATTRDVVVQYVRSAAIATAAGILAGTIVSQLLYAAPPLAEAIDSLRSTPLQWLGTIAAVLVFGSIAAIIPSLRAANVHPASVLRVE